MPEWLCLTPILLTIPYLGATRVVEFSTANARGSKNEEISSSTGWRCGRSFLRSGSGRDGQLHRHHRGAGHDHRTGRLLPQEEHRHGNNQRRRDHHCRQQCHHRLQRIQARRPRFRSGHAGRWGLRAEPQEHHAQEWQHQGFQRRSVSGPEHSGRVGRSRRRGQSNRQEHSGGLEYSWLGYRDPAKPDRQHRQHSAGRRAVRTLRLRRFWYRNRKAGNCRELAERRCTSGGNGCGCERCVCKRSDRQRNHEQFHLKFDLALPVLCNCTGCTVQRGGGKEHHPGDARGQLCRIWSYDAIGPVIAQENVFSSVVATEAWGIIAYTGPFLCVDNIVTGAATQTDGCTFEQGTVPTP